MKKAFTLIELLVVIAIIAILAAILFPVFAQAKTAAKKATSISNQKQNGLAILMYMNDADDKYPRNDGCQANSSLNTALNKPGAVTGDGCSGSGPYPYRMNHYAWQKWILPYTKSIDMFFSPVFGRVDPKNASGVNQWSKNGQLYSSYALNLSLTGALNTWGKSAGASGQFRDSWLGGSQSGVGSPSETMLLMELVSTEINFAPVFVVGSGETQTAYPVADRDLWRPMFNKRRGATGCDYTEDPDPKAVPFNGNIVIGFADGSVKAMATGQFLAKTPGKGDVTVSSKWSCAPDGGAWTLSSAPTWKGSWPLWGIQ